MYDKYNLIDDYEIFSLIDKYRKKYIKTKVFDSYLESKEIFSLFIEIIMAEEKGGIYKSELEGKKRLFEVFFKTDMFDEKLLSGIIPRIKNSLKSKGLM